jgi:hypothetical protein
LMSWKPGGLHLLDDFDGPLAKPFKRGLEFAAGIAAIGKTREGVTQANQEGRRAVAIRDAGLPGYCATGKSTAATVV